MKDDLTLVVLAGGMGSRFGGLKQIEPVGPSGEFIMDYSIYDAIKAGFNKVVFVIKEENYELFKEKVGKRIEDKIKVEYAFQDIKDIPKGFKVPKDRTKPWGTGQALLSAKNKVSGNLLMINADDFYGYESYLHASKFLNNQKDDYALIGYKVENTLTENGSVKRGVCEVKNKFLSHIVESSVIKENGVITATPLDGSDSFKVDDEKTVSMNMFCFREDIFKYLEEGFVEFFNDNKDNLEKTEFLIPQLVQEIIQKENKNVEVIPTNAKWYGITYKEDKEDFVKNINKLIEDGVYPENLWK